MSSVSNDPESRARVDVLARELKWLASYETSHDPMTEVQARRVYRWAMAVAGLAGVRMNIGDKQDHGQLAVPS